jgi:hypothetical protein
MILEQFNDSSCKLVDLVGLNVRADALKRLSKRPKKVFKGGRKLKDINFFPESFRK